MTERYRRVTEHPGRPANRADLARAIDRYSFVAERAAGGDVLEAACGAGIGLSLIASSARSVTAGDIAHANVIDAIGSACGAARIARFDARYLPFRDGSFDAVALLEAVYYLDGPERFLAEAQRVLRHGGHVIVSTVNPAWRDFGPSPLSVRYWDSRELDALLSRSGYETSLFAAFPAAHSWSAVVASRLRRLSAWLAIPWPSWSRRSIRRVLHGRSRAFPAALATRAPTAAVRIPGGTRDTEHQVIYAVGQKL